MKELVRVIEYCFSSPNEHDSNLEPANIVDGLYFLGRSIRRLADVIAKGQES